MASEGTGGTWLLVLVPLLAVVIFLLVQNALAERERKRLAWPVARCHLSRPPSTRRLQRISHKVTGALKRAATELVSSGSEQGLSICVYFEGEEIASVCCGSYRSIAGSDRWKPVTPDTRFMGYSVSKGIAASVILAMVDAGLLSYDERVGKKWKAFDRCNEKKQITVQDALSHRSGLQWTSVTFLVRYILTACQCTKSAWKVGEAMIQDYCPDWEPGAKAVYHPLSWSWIAGGIARRASKHPEGCINSELRERVCKPLKIPVHEVRIGQVPSREDEDIARLEPKGLSHHRRNAPWWKVGIGVVESCIFRTIGNFGLFRRICLPSSNAVWTPKAVARIYGAVSNRGFVKDQNHMRSGVQATDAESKYSSADMLRFVSNDTIKILRQKLCAPTVPGGHGQGPATLGLGYSPWSDCRLHGDCTARIVGHNGMGGFTIILHIYTS